MGLDKDTNYIVSGLERSGTSMMMQILKAGGLPVAYDDKRKPDDNNPKGYFELDGGKIINKLMNGSFPFNKYKGIFIKITAYGLKFLPEGKYKIIYMERNIEEVLDSMEKMARIKDSEREETRISFEKLNEKIKYELKSKDDTKFIIINYFEMIKNSEITIKKIIDFLEYSEINVLDMIKTVDYNLYRQRKN